MLKRESVVPIPIPHRDSGDWSGIPVIGDTV